MMTIFLKEQMLMQDEMDIEVVSRVLGHHNRCRNGMIKAAETHERERGGTRRRQRL